MSNSLPLALALALTLFAPGVFPAPPETRAQALAWLEDPATERRAEAVAWVATHGRMEDAELLMKRLRDEDSLVRNYAEGGLWLLWSRSGEPEIDELMAHGVAAMQAGLLDGAISTFTEVIRRRPDFAEAWNKRATAHFLAEDYDASLADCDEVMRRNPHHFGALSGYGQIYFRQGRYQKAIDAWRRALAVNPNLDGLRRNIQRAEERLRERRGRST